MDNLFSNIQQLKEINISRLQTLQRIQDLEEFKEFLKEVINTEGKEQRKFLIKKIKNIQSQIERGKK